MISSGLLISVAVCAGGFFLFGILSRLGFLGRLELKAGETRFTGRGELPAWLEGVYAPMEGELLALGFEPLFIRVCHPLENREVESFEPVYRHRELPILAYLQLLGQADAPVPVFVSLVTHFGEGPTLLTESASPICASNGYQSDEVVMTPRVSEVLARHRARLEAEGRQPLVEPWTEAREAEEYARQAECSLAADVEKGMLYTKGGVRKYRLIGALKKVLGLDRRAFEKYRKERANEPATDLAPEIRARSILHSRSGGAKGNPAIQAFNLILSGGLFLIAGSFLFQNAGVAALILILILLHECGHFLAMRLSGCRDISMIFLPGLGGATTGSDLELSTARRLIVLFAGPLPGMIIGAWLITDNDQLSIALGGLLFLINLFNLLPLSPFDGGRIADIVFFGAKGRASEVFKALSAIMLVVWGVLDRDMVLAGLGAFIGYEVYRNRGRARLVDSLAGRLKPEADGLAILTEAFRLIGESEGRTDGGLGAKKSPQALALWLERQIRLKPPSTAERVLGLIAYLGATVGLSVMLILSPTGSALLEGILSMMSST